MKKSFVFIILSFSLFSFAEFSQATGGEYKDILPKYYEYKKGFSIYADGENKNDTCNLHVSIKKKKDDSFLSKNIFDTEKNIDCNGYYQFIIIYNQINSEDYIEKINELGIFYTMENDNKNKNEMYINITYTSNNMGMVSTTSQRIKLIKNKSYNMMFSGKDPVLKNTVISINYQHK